MQRGAGGVAFMLSGTVVDLSEQLYIQCNSNINKNTFFNIVPSIPNKHST